MKNVEAQSNIIDISLDNNLTPQPQTKYQSLKKRKKSKKFSLLAMIKITFELSFLLITFFLSFLKALKVLGTIDHSNALYKKQLNSEKEKEKIDMKVCVCTSGKSQNKSIKEYVEYYQKYGVDKIFLYGNNNSDGEKYSEVINDYIKSGFVEILDWRGKQNEQLSMMNDCYQKNYGKYSWLIFNNIDEFIHFKNNNNIKYFLGQEKFSTCKKIYLNWALHTDSNLIHNVNKTLQQSLTENKENKAGDKLSKNTLIKSIIRGNISNIIFDSEHKLSNEILGCNEEGIEIKLNGNRINEEDFNNNYVDHYYYKSYNRNSKKIF